MVLTPLDRRMILIAIGEIIRKIRDSAPNTRSVLVDMIGWLTLVMLSILLLIGSGVE